MKRFRNDIIVFAIVAIVILVTYIFFKIHDDEKQKNDETKSDNTEIVMKWNKMKKEYEKEIDSLKKYGVKKYQIERIVKTEYRFIDSVNIRDSIVWVYDTIKNEGIGKWMVERPCYIIHGYIDGAEVVVDDVAFRDEMTISMYKTGCMFRKRYNVIVHSECMGDTMKVFKNVKRK